VQHRIPSLRWNTVRARPRWVPTFPNAKYLFSRAENEIGDPRRSRRRATCSVCKCLSPTRLAVFEGPGGAARRAAHAIDDTC
jgi:hypothetical protein